MAWALLKDLPLRELEGCVTGLAALAGYWLHHREVDCLELAASSADLLQALKETAARVGVELAPGPSFPGFHRFTAVLGQARLRLDVSIEATTSTPGEEPLPASSLDELAVDRCLRLLGGGDVLLLVDLYFLSRVRVDIERAAEGMSRLDMAATPSALAVVLHQLEVTQVPPEVIRPVTQAELAAFSRVLVSRLAMRTYGD